MDKIIIFTDQIMRGAKAYGQRTGQYLFNHLPEGATTAVAGTPVDPFHKDLDKNEIFDWLSRHVIFDDNDIIGIFAGNQILWEKQP